MPRNVFKRGVNGEECERRIDMCQHEYYGKWTIKEESHRLANQVEILEEAVQDAVAAENGFPRVAAHEVADPKRNDHQLVEQVLPRPDRKSTRLNSSHRCISYAVFCLKKKNNYT